MISLNWGTKIVFLYTGFVLLIGTLVWKSTQTKFDLVSEDYYEQEIGFQKKLDAKGNAAALTQKPITAATDKTIMVFFPQDLDGMVSKADVVLYNPSNAANDQAFKGLSVVGNKIEIPRDKIVPAPYILKLSWEMAGKSYYQEMPLKLTAK